MKGRSAPLARWELDRTASLFPMILHLNLVILSHPNSSPLTPQALTLKCSQDSLAKLSCSGYLLLVGGRRPGLQLVVGLGKGGPLWGRGESTKDLSPGQMTSLAACFSLARKQIVQSLCESKMLFSFS